MNSRIREAAMLERCAVIARAQGKSCAAEDAREANILRVAAMVIQSRFPAESKAMMQCAERYFAERPDDLRPVVDVIRNGDVISLPRLRDSLTRKFNFSG